MPDWLSSLLTVAVVGVVLWGFIEIILWLTSK